MSTTPSRTLASKTNTSSVSSWLILIIYLLGMIALWTIATAASHRAPYLDGMEGLIWASSLEWGYAKHPPLPTWIMYAFVELFGREVWVSFFAGQVMSALALVFVYLFGREITTPRRALLATLMVSVTMYFSLRSTIFNHNTAQLWSIAACIWLFYRALKFNSLVNWAALGFVAGLAMLTKYSALVQFGAFFLFMLIHGDLRRKSVQKGLLVGAGVCLVVLLPHLLWLASNHFAPLHYADASMQSHSYPQAWKSILEFVLDQLARLSPMFLLWGALWYWQRRKPIETLHLITDQTYAGLINAGARQFLIWVGLGPFVLTVLISAALGTSLTASWGTTFFVLFGFYAFWKLKGNDRIWLQRTLILAIAMQLAMAITYGLARGPIAEYTGRDARSVFAGPELAGKLNAIWEQHVPNTPVPLVASDRWFGGNIALNLHRNTQVFISADYFKSPWLDPETALNCGALVVYAPEAKGYWSPKLIALYQKASIKGEFEQHWSRSGRSPSFIVQWGIITPGPQCGQAKN
ncbi:MAG TPA: hypothetical protein DEB15_11270 [Pusillimonas sp.]|jgi:4-amino-4-deoxy-L-arabinose transferase-like glycosyltransferase|nr:hypothetical protein [Pusillimonas sp.]|tara:strand:- start:3644 stop:5209 length:1566 start_codon:yes stop_codon:yes gene_type:complete